MQTPEVRLIAVEIRDGERVVLAEAIADRPCTGPTRVFLGDDAQWLTKSIHRAFGEVLDTALNAVDALAADKSIDWVSEAHRVSEMTGKG